MASPFAHTLREAAAIVAAVAAVAATCCGCSSGEDGAAAAGGGGGDKRGGGGGEGGGGGRAVACTVSWKTSLRWGLSAFKRLPRTSPTELFSCSVCSWPSKVCAFLLCRTEFVKVGRDSCTDASWTRVDSTRIVSIRSTLSGFILVFFSLRAIFLLLSTDKIKTPFVLVRLSCQFMGKNYRCCEHSYISAPTSRELIDAKSFSPSFVVGRELESIPTLPFCVALRQLLDVLCPLPFYVGRRRSSQALEGLANNVSACSGP